MMPSCRYDPDADAVYVTFGPEMTAGEAAKTYSCDPAEVDGAMINLDFDAQGRLLGIEILDAKKTLKPEFLAHWSS